MEAYELIGSLVLLLSSLENLSLSSTILFRICMIWNLHVMVLPKLEQILVIVSCVCSSYVHVHPQLIRCSTFRIISLVRCTL